MAEELQPNFEQIAKDCLINRTDDAGSVISKIGSVLDGQSDENRILTVNYLFSISNDYRVLNYLLKKMNEYKSPLSVPILVDTLLLKGKHKAKIQDFDIINQIKVNAVKILANIKDSSAVNSLIYCLNDKNENYKVRLSCAEALGKIGDKYAVMPLVDVLEDETEHSVYIKESVAFALGLLGDVQAVESLVRILETKKKLESKFSFLKEKVIEALNKLNPNNDRVFNALKNSLNDDSEQVRIKAIEALSEIGDDNAEILIYNALNDKSDEVVKNALIALYNMKDKDYIKNIIESTTSARLAASAKEVMLEIERAEEEDDG